MITAAAILARGHGTRMRAADEAASINVSQSAAADAGLKGMIPLARPFLEYIISALADAGIMDVVLVIAPDHEIVRTHFDVAAPPTRARIRYALQQEALGTADAVVAAASVIGDEPFLVLNADNYYPADALRLLASENSAGTIAFDRDTLIRDGNIDAERVRSFAVLDIADDDTLLAIIEKPGASLDPSSPSARWVGMNCWAVTPDIVDACARVARSVRGEFELPEAVALALSEGTRVRALRMQEPVFDLSRRADIADVAARLAHVAPVP